MAKNFLPQSLVKELFEYNPVTGHLNWRIPWGEQEAGSRAGALHRSSGARIIVLGRIQYLEHILIWILVTGVPPKDEIDHENRNRSDNRWKNLREATRSQNQANTSLYKNSSTKVRGVHFIKSSGRYRAMISKDGKNRHLGYFPDRETAEQAWKAAAQETHGEFASL